MAASRTTQSRKPHNVDALLLVAESNISLNSFERLNLLMLCAIMRKMSAQQRVLLVRLLVRSFAAATRYVPLDAQPIMVAAELPPVLERIAEHIQASTQTWVGWTDNRRTWFVVADMDTERDGSEDAAAIRIAFYDEDGECISAGAWAFNSHGKWRFDSMRAVDMPAVVTAGAE